ncbi:MAG: hypothetical protein ABI633_08595, partial [Burkholderiales bacterium]
MSSGETPSARKRSAVVAKAFAASSVIWRFVRRGLKLSGASKQRRSSSRFAGVAELLERDDVALARRAVEVGVDLDPQPVADDEQRRVVERERIRHQLPERGVERLARRLVLPREAAALEDVGIAAALARWCVTHERALLEQIVVATHRGRD